MHETQQTCQTFPNQNSEAIDVDGIEIFNLPSASTNSNLTTTSRQVTGNSQSGLSIKDAAKVLGISTNTVRAKIKSGELSAEKVKGPTNDQWRVFLGLPANSQQVTNNPAATLSTDKNPEMQRLLDIVEKQSAKLEAASGQIGYLQAQLQASQEQVKLLTDSQHKAGWWRRFCARLGFS